MGTLVIHTHYTLFDSIASLTSGGSCQINVDSNGKLGIISGGDNHIVSAQYGPLSGNGALLSIACLEKPQLSIITRQKTEKKRSVTLTFAQCRDALSKITRIPWPSHYDDIVDLRRAIDEAYLCQYEEAKQRLTRLIQINPFNYLAWLWLARLSPEPNRIKETLAEAQRFGNASQAVQTECIRNQLALEHVQEHPVTKCPFCWSIVRSSDTVCPHCHGCLCLTSIQTGIPAETARFTIAATRFARLVQNNPDNMEYLRNLALAHVTLKQHDKALAALQGARNRAAKHELHDGMICDLEATQHQTAKPATLPHQPEDAGQQSPKKTILLVEDSNTSRKVLSLILSRTGYTVLEADRGSDALRIATTNTPAMIILDIMLPDINGYDLLNQLRQKEQLTKVPVVIFSGSNSLADQIKGREAGVIEYLTKPFNPQQLVSLVDHYLG